MEQWLESVYSDGSPSFVSDPLPQMGQTVTIWLRMYDTAPVRNVFLRTVPNGAELLLEMRREKVSGGLAWYATELKITEKRMQYQFYLVCDQVIYYYNQKEITTYIPDQTYDFVLLADYQQPQWVKNAVFYQIFPDRFYNGDPENDVKDGEYSLNGKPSIQVKNWNDPPLPYDKGFCLDFYGGDLDGIIAKIPYLKELGVTAIYLNPIFLAPSVHKYDCIDYFQVDPHFGGDEALARLTDALHQNGMRLVLDISINHTGTAHKWFNRDGLFFDKTEGGYHNPHSQERSYYFFSEDNSYVGWYGVSELPTLNYTAKPLRQIIYEDENSVLRKWLKPPYSIDGWRFDVADVFARNNEVQLAPELWPQIRKAIKEENPEGYILAEDWGDCAAYLQGDEWDAPMNYFGFGRVIRQLLGLPDLFLMRNPVLGAVPYKMTVEDAKNRIMSHLAKLPFAVWQNQFNLFDSHDVPRVHNHPGIDPEEYRGAIILQFSMIGAPSVYYGDEAQADGKTDTNENCRYPMPWDKNFEEDEIYKLHRQLAHIKTGNRAFTEGGMKFLYAQDGVLALARFTKEQAFVTVFSIREEETSILLPLGAVGAAAPADGETDMLGTPLRYTQADENHIWLNVNAHKAYLFACEMK